MSIFGDIAKAKAHGGGDNFKPGMGKVAIKAMRHRKGFKGEFFIGEFKVLESTEKEKGVSPNLPGSSVAQVCPLTGDKNAVMMGQVNALKMAKAAFECAGAVNLDEATLEKELEGVVQPNQPLRGFVLGYETRQVTTKKGLPITVVDFKPLKQTADDVKKMRETLDAEEPFVP